ncbi:DUF222 domain-containing protein [Planococcus sp. APC 4015]|nr:DUF222 domain-containing protein [Planococcus sp. APC 4015]
MTDPLARLAEVLARVEGIWGSDELSALNPGDLIAVNAELGTARRLIEGVQARVASEIARQSRPELGAGSLAKMQGFRSPTALIASTTGTSQGDAARLVQVGDATTPRTTFTGEAAPPRHPHVAGAVQAGLVGASAAAAIIRMLDRVAIRAGKVAVERAERMLVDHAPGLTVDQLNRTILRIEAVLDPIGVEPRETDLREDMSLIFREEPNGMLVITARLDPEHAAPVRTAIDALVTAELRARHDGGPDNAGGIGGVDGRAVGSPLGGNAGDQDVREADRSRRTIPQLQADAFVRLIEHTLGCDRRDLPLGGATVIVRIDLADLENDTGHATIDGITAPISAATARRMAAAGGIIPCILGGESDILDWGRAKRLFTPTQKLAIIERDGGCVNCAAPPGHTKVHHIRWWARDAGPTDLRNGVLLCESCHHRIHDNGFDIRVDGTGTNAIVWIIPPAHIDPARTPRRGHRAHYRLAS